MKIQIIGYSGSGKSTLAKRLAEHYHIPLLYLDTVQFYDDWKERPLFQQNEIVETFLNQHDAWVIDGNYGRVAPRRFQECDMIIYLNYSRLYCYMMALQRYFQNKGHCRESCSCIEKFDLEFQKWILIDGRTSQQKKKHLEHLSMCQKDVYVFKNRRQLHQFLKEKGIGKPII